MTHDQFADWSGAYVMGALGRVERQQYEDHLACCGLCTDAVAELSPLPGLLGRISPEDAELLLAGVPSEMPDDLVARTLAASQIAQPRRIRMPLRVALATAAAAVVAAAVVIPIQLHHESKPDETIQLAQVVESPLTATVSLTATDWGTRVDMDCFYAASRYGGQRPYELYVLDPAGKATLVSSWHAGPGEEAKTTGSTNLPLGDVRAVQVRATDGTVLLSANA